MLPSNPSSVLRDLTTFNYVEQGPIFDTGWINKASAITPLSTCALSLAIILIGAFYNLFWTNGNGILGSEQRRDSGIKAHLKSRGGIWIFVADALRTVGCWTVVALVVFSLMSEEDSRVFDMPTPLGAIGISMVS